jgi:hypothetical protein
LKANQNPLQSLFNLFRFRSLAVATAIRSAALIFFKRQGYDDPIAHVFAAIYLVFAPVKPFELANFHPVGTALGAIFVCCIDIADGYAHFYHLPLLCISVVSDADFNDFDKIRALRNEIFQRFCDSNSGKKLFFEPTELAILPTRKQRGACLLLCLESVCGKSWNSGEGKKIPHGTKFPIKFSA